MARFEIEFYGHQNILALHRTTLEITKEKHLSPKGDCIIGVNASASVSDFPAWLKGDIKEGKKIVFTITVSKSRFSFEGYGSNGLSLSDPMELVIRKSDYISARTAAIKSTASAINIPRDIIKTLKDATSLGKMEITTA
ncbi:MAG: DUF371 domain-containing protein [Nitrososphaerota archaeon]|jgi:hypothetical protein|nr:DUF371 domain-containing protein [Nitrososphaerota archaeon]MDG6927237.1 DUF371 domain-containing protein [Nitrososphaerota archaeon]MDG6929705.1 DUF371 domain-containing protein [Nitrososphaerota archaeon]MDG6932680.1 DUF371 domain-containing protein [Nitrososphaerota archaeon]MDG6936138.1 DUF371 domain-containing protein [Nitrososphaerota archaeon]